MVIGEGEKVAKDEMSEMIHACMEADEEGNCRHLYEQEVKVLREELEKAKQTIEKLVIAMKDIQNHEMQFNEHTRGSFAYQTIKEALAETHNSPSPKRHAHQESRTCTCWPLALEPDEKCPRHGAGEWPPRCEMCGRFMKRKYK